MMTQVDNQHLDYSQPLAGLLRTSTRKVHDTLSSRAAKLLGGGELPKDEYVRLLMMFWHVYSALEQALEQHASHPALEPTYNPLLLARTPALSSDISHLLQVPEDAWRSHPIYVDLTVNMPQALTAYVDRIRVLANASSLSPASGSSACSSPPGSTPNADTTPAQLLSHAYVRYLGDLSGGQSTRYTLAKAYQLEVDSIESAGPGVSFYAFKSLRSNKLANQGEMKRIKEWFRDGVNRVGEMLCDQDKQVIIAEAQKAFEFNAALFECLRLPPSGPTSDINSDPDMLLGPSRSSSNSGPATRGSSEKAPSVNWQKLGSASHIVMVLLAVFLAHFAWSAGVPELFRFEQWTLSFLASSTSD